jgi:hypothetical protein
MSFYAMIAAVVAGPYP